MRALVWPVVLVILAAVIYRGSIHREMVDFKVYRTAADRALKGETLYRTSDAHYQFKYLPAFAVAMVPFAKLDLEAAKAIWFALSAGLLTMLVRWSLRGLPERRRRDAVLIGFVILFMAKFYAHELTLGQTNILLATLIVAGLLAVQVDEPHLGAGLFALAAFVKPYALILLPWLAVSAGFGPALTGLGVLGIGLAAPSLLFGWQGNAMQLAAWYQTVRDTTAPNLLGADNISIAAMWAKWIGLGPVANALTLLVIGALLALTAWVWQKRSTVDSPEYLEIAMLMVLVPLISPQGWDYVLLLATPATIVIVDRWYELTPAWRYTAIAAQILMGLTIFDVMGRALYARFMALSIVSVAAIVIVVVLAQLRRAKLA